MPPKNVDLSPLYYAVSTSTTCPVELLKLTSKTLSISYDDFTKNSNEKKKNNSYITKVEELGDRKVVRCTFNDGDVQKAVCCESDEYSLETGISVCIAKHFIGGTKAYNDAIRQGLKCHKRQSILAREEAETALAKKRRRERNEAVRQRKKEKRREQYIREQAEILAKAQEIAEQINKGQGNDIS